MHNKIKYERHELMYGPHFNEECALKAVSKMENEDGSKGAHWDLLETTQIAQQYNINLTSGKFNKYDWFVALNMVRSDYYRFIVSMTNSDNVKYFVELAKAWLNDKDIEEGKMWNYFRYIMCPAEDTEHSYMHSKYEDDDDDDYSYMSYRDKAYKPMRKRYMEDDDDEDEAYYRARISYRREPRYISRY